MMRYFVSVLCALMIVGATPPSHARDADGNYIVLGNISCREYLRAYGKTTTTLDGHGYDGPHEFWEATGWINGYISGYNAQTANGQKNIAAGLSHNEMRRWIASWCRKNRPKDLADAMAAFIASRDEHEGRVSRRRKPTIRQDVSSSEAGSMGPVGGLSRWRGDNDNSP